MSSIGNCGLCQKEEFIYYWQQRAFPYLKICSNCQNWLKYKVKAKKNTDEILMKINVRLNWIVDFPNKEHLFRQQINEMIEELKNPDE